MPLPKANPEVCIGVEPEPAPGLNEARFRRLLEAAPDAILEVNADGRITVANAAAEHIFGYTRAELIGQKH